ncbi:uncharacterized protein BD780_001663 [Clostridium tetanomorphum]|uniref:Thioether cross-link-forming SCIFF peptide maturase n=1 Tax=Clostridium tetanomorphum TaxID=1553 RepID=A0A923E7T9_CLOTT|nr:ScfB-related radical SAM/SPASM orphan maturase [Clostridium tetanomorphum]KAJ52735.1 heme biosynthesis (nirJ-2) family protein [Clostridium tetanomorphum DSM 665]MBC2396711.1 thioether cross-link-forming SCIFF peptide maturase [Clostridium tetanomorphum]MBP1863330.1 uncharacterized protein [Clostridium tetanomorphum]NRS84438.1 uncharacterized protein [Clostridium tetanomorphum]NRZ97652.1 uncharacterized protein [Clostridium tetanomorphum]
MSLIHKFIQGDEYYIIDVNTGNIFSVDKMVYDILDEDFLRSKNQIMKKFQNKYSKKDISEAYDEIFQLVKEDSLYSKDLYEDIAKKSTEDNSFIKALCLNIVHDCNLRCKYCFADEGEYKGCRKIMSLDVSKQAIDFVIKHSGSRKNIEIDLFGGEPLMAFDNIKEIVEYGKEQGKIHNKIIRFTMTTNATLFNDENIKYLNDNMGNIVLSIDGRKEVNDNVRVRIDGSGSYDKILPNIKKVVAARGKSRQYYVRATFTRANTDFFKDIIHLANQGFDKISVEPVILSNDNPLSLREEDLPIIFEQYDKLYYEMLKRHKKGNEFEFYHFNIDLQGGPCVYKRISGCGAGHEYVAITPDGDIYPCHQFIGNEDFKIGTIYENSYSKDIGNKIREAHIYNKPKCRECWARFYCSGGCAANNYNFNKDICIPYEIGCKMQKKRIECAIALKAKAMQ